MTNLDGFDSLIELSGTTEKASMDFKDDGDGQGHWEFTVPFYDDLDELDRAIKKDMENFINICNMLIWDKSPNQYYDEHGKIEKED